MPRDTFFLPTNMMSATMMIKNVPNGAKTMIAMKLHMSCTHSLQHAPCAASKDFF